MKNKLMGILQGITLLAWLPSILLINGCDNKGNVGWAPSSQNNNSVSHVKLPEKETNHSNASEIIVFVGNPGVGKSSLCNSIFQKKYI